MECTGNNTDNTTAGFNGTTFYHVFTILMERSRIQFSMNATTGLSMHMKNVSLEIEFDRITHSSIGPVNEQMNGLIKNYVVPFIKPTVQFEMETRPIPVGVLVRNNTAIEWVDFADSDIEFYDYYFTIYTSPIFAYPRRPEDRYALNLQVDEASEQKTEIVEEVPLSENSLSRDEID